jgi:hypothetical protein
MKSSASRVAVDSQIYDNGTNIGIGSASPSQKLDVVGIVKATAFAGPLTGAVTGNASTATALAASGTTCNAGYYARGVDASGNAVNCSADQTGGGGSISGLTSGYVPVANSSTTIVDSGIYTNDGKVGIGTATPQSGFQYHNNASFAQLRVTSVDDNSYNAFSQMLFGSGLTLAGGYAEFLRYGNSSPSAGNFYIENHPNKPTFINNTSAGNVYLATGGGRVGIGGPSPNSKLDVYTASVAANTNVLTLSTGGYGASNVEQRIRIYDNRDYDIGYMGGGFFPTVGGGYLAFGTMDSSTAGLAATEKMRLTSQGYLGIGTNAPQCTLHVVGNLRIHVDGSDSLTPAFYFANVANSRAWNTQLAANHDLAFWRYDGSTWAEEIRMTQTGNLGIGTTAPVAKIDIAGQSASVGALHLTAGTLTTAPVAGNVEFDGTDFYFSE